MDTANHIVFIITDYGSFNIFFGELAVSLRKQGKKITVICSPEKVIAVEDKYDYKEAEITFIDTAFPRNFNIFQHFKTSKEIQRYLKEIKPDFVSIHFTTAITTTLLRGKPKVKTIGTYHGIGFPMVENRWKKLIFKTVEFHTMEILDEIWLLNEFDFKIAQKKFPDKSFLLPTKGLGCDLNVFDPDLYSEKDKTELRKKLGIEKNDFLILFTGRFVDFKGYDIVIRTFFDLQKRKGLKNIKLITLGGFDKAHPTGLTREDEIYMKNNDSIKNIGFTKDVAKYLSIADLFFFPSKKEGIPVCITEALAMQVPVLTYDIRGCNDLVFKDYNGILLDTGKNYKDFSEEIVHLINNKEKQSYYIQNMKKDRRLYSRDNFIKHQLNYFNYQS